MVIVLFKTKLRADADLAAYEKLGLRMYELVSRMEGFVSFSEAQLPDRESLGIVTFASPEALEAWRRHPEHVEAQRQGRERFYEAYSIKVCAVTRESEWSRTP
ncbi:MAG: antibiotic biosynthesis monooxygenase family protein [Candidatus Rokuibacteriota bacterium]